MANIILANISILRKELNEIEYKLNFSNHCKETITACHTNESVLKAFAEYHPIKETGGVHKIIALVSQKVLNEQHIQIKKTAFEYITDCAQALWPNVEIYPIYIEDAQFNELSTQSILEQVCNHITTNDKVYIDCAGGMRTTSNVIQIMTKLLQYKGIDNPLSLYSNVQNNNSFIDDNSSFEKMTYLADAFNEFMTTGKSDLLNHYVPTQEYPQLSKLLKTMRSFSNCIRILDIDNLDRIIRDLQTAINDYRDNGIRDNIESVIVHQFLPIIQKKLLGDEISLDYLSITQWCLDNALLQQALTIYESKIPQYLFDKKLIMFRGESKKKDVYEMFTNNKGNTYSFETYALYTDLLAYKETNPILDAAKEHLLLGKEAKHPQVIILSREMQNMRRYFPDSKTKSRPTFVETEITKLLLDFKKQSSNKTYDAFVKSLCNNQKKLMECLGISEEKDSYSNKLKAIENIHKQDLPTYKFKDRVALAKILYAYIFLKQERNRTNHAMSEKINDFTSEQKDLFRQEGFIVNLNNDYEDLCLNVQRGIDLIREAISTSEESKDISFEPTALAKDDILCAKCIDNKKVIIENHPYEIQMTIPKDYDLKYGSFSLIGKNVQVRVKQISKAGKIAQVEFIKIIKQ